MGAMGPRLSIRLVNGAKDRKHREALDLSLTSDQVMARDHAG
jgi:hypothetical protein